MAWFHRHFWAFLGVVGVGIAALLIKQGIAIAEHGISGWLRGDGGYQTEWEVRAVVGLLLVGLPATVLAALFRSSEGTFHRLREWRWERAIRRSRKP